MRPGISNTPTRKLIFTVQQFNYLLKELPRQRHLIETPAQHPGVKLMQLRVRQTREPVCPSLRPKCSWGGQHAHEI
jgi:hypothetical protein